MLQPRVINEAGKVVGRSRPILLHQQPEAPASGCRQAIGAVALDFGCNLSRRSVPSAQGPRAAESGQRDNLGKTSPLQGIQGVVKTFQKSIAIALQHLNGL